MVATAEVVMAAAAREVAMAAAAMAAEEMAAEEMAAVAMEGAAMASRTVSRPAPPSHAASATLQAAPESDSHLPVAAKCYCPRSS